MTEENTLHLPPNSPSPPLYSPIRTVESEYETVVNKLPPVYSYKIHGDNVDKDVKPIKEYAL